MKRKKIIPVIISLYIAGGIGLVNQVFADGSNISRVNGKDAYDTSAIISQKNFANSDLVILASGDQQSDAFIGKILSQKYKSPLLLTKSNSIPDSVSKEIKRLNTKKVIIVGGEKSIDDNVKNKLLQGHEVQRISGKNRFETSLMLAKEMNGGRKISNGVIFVNGNKFTDTAVASSVSQVTNKPLILTDGKNLTSGLNDAIDLSSSENIIVGGNKSFDIPSVKGHRLAGKNRYETAIKIADKFYPDKKKAIIVNGQNQMDSVLATALNQNGDLPILLSLNNSYDVVLKGYIENKGIKNVVVLGDDKSISESAISSIKDTVDKVTSGNATTTSVDGGQSLIDKAKEAIKNSYESSKSSSSGKNSTSSSNSSGKNSTSSSSSSENSNTSSDSSSTTESATTNSDNIINNSTPASINGNVIGSTEHADDVDNVDISNVTELADGDFVGVSNSIINSINNAKNEVLVKVRNHRIVSIDLTKRGDDGGLWYDTAKVIFPMAIENQNVDKMLNDIYAVNKIHADMEREGKSNFKSFLSNIFGANKITEKILKKLSISDDYTRRKTIAELYADKNDVDIDALSSATMSKTSYLQAIKNAVDRSKAKTAKLNVSNVKLISEFKEPKRVYTEGDHLDLSGLVVKMTMLDGQVKNIPFADFAKNNITVNLENGSTLTESKKLIITHVPTKTIIEYFIVVNPNIKPITITKIKYTLSGEEEKEVTVSSKNGFTFPINFNMNAIGKKFTSIKLIDNEDHEIPNVKFLNESGESIGLDELGNINNKQFEVNIALENTPDMIANKKDYKYKNIYLDFNSKTADFSKLSYIGLNPSSTYNPIIFRGFPVTYDGLKIDLYNSDRQVFKTIDSRDFSEYGITVTPAAGFPLGYGDAKKSGISISFDVEGTNNKLYTDKRLYKQTNGDWQVLNVEIKDKETSSNDSYKDPVVYRVASMKEEKASNFKKSYRVGEKLDLHGLAIVLLDEHGNHPDNHPNEWPSGTPDKKRNHTNIDLLVPTIPGENDGSDGANNRFDINNITTNLPQGHVITANDTKLVLTYTSKENNGGPVTLEIPLTINNEDGNPISSGTNGSSETSSSENNGGSSSSTTSGSSENDNQPALPTLNPEAKKNDNVQAIAEETDSSTMKKEYVVGDRLSFDGLKLKFLDYPNDGSPVQMKPGVDSDVNNFYLGKEDFDKFGILPEVAEGTVLNQIGEKDITFNYFGMKTTIKINVVSSKAPIESQPKVELPTYYVNLTLKPYKTSYTTEENVDLNGLGVEVKKTSDNNSIELSPNDNSGDTKTVIPLNEFEKYNLRTNIQNGSKIDPNNLDLKVSWFGNDNSGEKAVSEPFKLTLSK